MSRQSPLFSIFVSLVFLSGFGSLIWVGIARPITKWREDVLVSLASEAATVERLTKAKTRLRTEIAAFDSGDLSNLYWVGSSQGTNNAQIQAQINKMAIQNGVEIRSVSPIRPTNETDENSVNLRLEFEAQLDRLVGLLRAIEYHEPILVIEKATFRRLTKPGNETVQPLIFAQIQLSAPSQILTGDQQ